MNKKLAWGAYLAVVHLALLAGVLRSSALVEPLRRIGIDHPNYTTGIERASRVLRRVDATVPAGAAVFLGDSITLQMATASVAPLAVNFGVGGQRADHLLRQLPAYHSLARARVAVLLIGTNDVISQQEDQLPMRYRELLAKIPAGVPVVLASIPPNAARQAQAAAAARAARQACGADPRCDFVDVHAALSAGAAPRTGVLEDDGVHLTDEGYRILINALRPAVARAPKPAA